MGTSYTRLKINNQTNTDIINTIVSEVDLYDWKRDSGPHLNFNGVFIGAKTFEERREDLYNRATTCPFTMTLRFADGTEDTFRINQEFALGYTLNFKHIRMAHDIVPKRTGSNIVEITIKNTQEQINNERAEELYKQGIAAMNQKQYKAALRQFEEASRLANQSHTIKKISAIKLTVYKQIQNEQAERLIEEGEAAMNQEHYEAAIESFQQALRLANQSNTIYRINWYKYMASKQLQNQQAEKRNKEGEAAMKQKQYETAIRKFEEALLLANHSDTVDRIKANNAEAYKHLQNKQTDARIREGEAAMRQKEYQTAITKFEEALRSTNESSTVERINESKAKAHYQQGHLLLQQAWDLEMDVTQDKSQEAESKFNEAKSMFRQAEHLGHATAHESLTVVDMKIEGNRLFNEANELEREAFRLFQEAKDSGVFEKYNTAQSKYGEALSKYKEAKDMYDRGLAANETNFDESSKFASEQIEDVSEVISDLDKIKLNHNIQQVNVTEDKGNKVDDDEQPYNNIYFVHEVDGLGRTH